MKLLNIGSFFSKKFKSRKRGRIESPSFKSATTASSSYEEIITPKSVLQDAIDDLFDRDGDGKISKRELEIVLKQLGPHDPPTADGNIVLKSATTASSSYDEIITPKFVLPVAIDDLFDRNVDGKISKRELEIVISQLSTHDPQTENHDADGNIVPKSSTTASSSYEKIITPKSVLPVAIDDLFSVFDRDGDGKITKRELEIVLKRLGPNDPPTEDELTWIVADIDRDGDGCISLEELGALALAVLGTPAACDEIRDVFSVFDADGDGKISAEELLGVFIALGDCECTIDDCRRMIVGVDSDGDGCVCFTDFARMMDGII